MHPTTNKWLNDYSQRLGSFEQFGELSMVRRAFKNYLVYNSCDSRYGIGRDDDESKLAYVSQQI